MLITLIMGRLRLEDGGSSCRDPLRLLKLTSRTTMLPDDMISQGKAPDSELPDRLRRDKLARPPSEGDTLP